MAARKSQAPAGTEVNPGTDEGAAKDQTAETAPVTTPETAAVPTEEERIRQDADRKREQRAGEAAVRTQKFEARAEALQGELDRANAALRAAEQRIESLTAQLAEATSAAKTAGTAIAGLPDNARQVNESVTVASSVPGFGKGGRLHVKAGDVLIVTKDEGEWSDLQKQLGLRATVYRVSKATLDELESTGFLHK